MNDDALRRKSDSTRSLKNKQRARCPSCGSWVNLRDNAEVWDLVDCSECDTRLEVVELRPPTLDYANRPDEEEWEDEDWDEEKDEF